MSSDRSKPVKPKSRVARKSGGPPAGPGGDGAAEKQPSSGPLAKGAMAQEPAVAMPLARAPRVTKPGDAEEVEADKAAARVASGEKTGPVEAQPATAARAAAETEQPVEGTAPTVARKVDTETPPPVEQLPVATKPVARATTGTDAPPDAAPESVTDVIASPGQGRPLAPDTREAIERRMPVDLRGVRVHDDATAQGAARAIDARAFTHGSDIWLGHGESDRDVGLMAHEAAHVAQQTPAVARAPDKPAKTKVEGPLIDRWPETDTENAPGFIDPAAGKLRIPKLKVPDFKAKLTEAGNVQLKRRPPRENKQIEDWEGSFGEAVPDLKFLNAKPRKLKDVAEPTFFLKPRKGSNTYVIGSEKTVRQRARRPSWDKDGKPWYFQVDHKWEFQLGGPDRAVDNLWLLDAEANQSSGREIKDDVKDQIAALVKKAPDTLRNKPLPEEVRDSYKSVTVKELVPGKNYTGKPGKNYDKADIEAGASLSVLDDVGDQASRLSGSAEEISLFERKEGGKLRVVAITDGVGKLDKPKISDTVEILGVKYSPETKTGSVRAMLFANTKGIEKFPVDDIEIAPVEGVQFGGYVNPQAIHNALVQKLKPKPLSPITIEDIAFDWEQGVLAAGKLTPSVPLIDQLKLDLRIDGKGVYLSRVFNGPELAFPGPVKVVGSSLEIQFGTHGFALIGRVPFVIEGFGKGMIEASVASKGEAPTFELVGTLELDTELFDKAEITVRYKDGKFSGDGLLEIGPKKLKGVKSATIKAAIDEDRIEASGDVVMDIPGVEKGNVTLVYDKLTGLEIGGTLQLSNSIPALKSGTIAVKVRRAPEGPWAVSGDIEATAGVPGITATIKGRYEDGAFEVFGSVGYERGMLKGTVDVGATNRPVGDDGRPAGDPTDKLTAFGRGEVTVRLAKWLQGTVGLQVLPNGQMVVSGKIGLPSTLDLFDQKEIKKRIFEIGLDIPIVGFSVLGQRVGIFATIGGGLDAEASIGPGQLRKAELGVTYNPDDEAATHVTGGAELFIPAHAGLRLFVSGAVGAGIPIVSAKVGLEVGAALGLDAALQSTLQVDWTPGKGLVLDADLSAYVQPKFVFDLTAFAKVEVDYLFGSSTLYDERWKLKQFEYGSDLRFGVKFPVHYEEGKEFDVALSDVQFEYPQIDTGALLKGLVKSIV